MATGAPIYNEEDVRRMEEALQNGIHLEHKRKDRSGNQRDALFFHLAVNTALRVSDLLPATPGDMLKSYDHGNKRTYRWKRHWIVVEKKTGKERRITLSTSTRQKIKDYIDYFKLEPEEPLFFSMTNPQHPIDRHQIYRRLKDVAIELKIDRDDHVFTLHSLRKTLPRKIYDETGNIALPQKILNHASSRMTMRYLGIRQDEIDGAMLEHGFD